MRTAYPSVRVTIRATLICFVALVVAATALLSLAQKPAESQQAPEVPLYEVHDLGTLAGGSYSDAGGINEAGKVVGVASLNHDNPEGADYHAFLHSDGMMHDLGTLPGGNDSEAADINDADKVVGTSTTSADGIERHAFLYSGGPMQDLGTLQGYSDSFATAINNNDEVVGFSSMAHGFGERAFIYSNGEMRDLGTLGSPLSFAKGINDAGQVVGWSFTSEEETSENPVTHAFIYSDGVMRDLNRLIPENSGWVLFDGMDINEAGTVVGIGDAGGGQRTFLYSGGQVRDVGTLGKPYDGYSYPTAVNNADQVVGQSATTDSEERPFLYSDGQTKNLNSLIPADSGWEILAASDINDKGYIVGRGLNSDGRHNAVVMKPHLDGFYQPVDNLPILNKTKPGKTIPLRFSWGMGQGLDIFAEGYPKSEAIPCDSTATVDGIEETSTGKGGLSYSSSTNSYEYAWATSSSWSGCRQFVMKLKDGTVQQANFIFR